MPFQITSVLELEMNQLSLSEAEESRMQGEEARKLGEESRKQGKILMAFTTVTVIFVSFLELLPNTICELIHICTVSSIIYSLSVCLEYFNIPTCRK